MNNIYSNIEIPRMSEKFEEILSLKNVKIERIISSSSPEQVEYKQDQDEWVLLLKGGAILSIGAEEIQLKEGDYVFISAGEPHKVIKTAEGTVWLVVHIFTRDK